MVNPLLLWKRSQHFFITFCPSIAMTVRLIFEVFNNEIFKPLKINALISIAIFRGCPTENSTENVG